MTRMSLLLASLPLCFGCQSTRSTPPAPFGLEDRLARLEERRFAEASNWHAPRPAGVVQVTSRQAASDLPFTIGPTDILTMSTGSSTDDDLPILTLSESGDTDDVIEPQVNQSDRYTRRSPQKSFYQTAKQDIKDMPCDLWRDVKRVYGNPVNLVILGTAYGGSLALRETGPDRTVERHFNRRHDLQPAHHHFKEDWRDAFGAMGNPGTHFALAGAWYLLGQQTMDDKTYEVGKTLFSALIINGVTVMVGQAATYDKAPNGEYGTMPSGHTSSSFVFASVMHEAYGHLVGLPLYGLATLAAYERVEDGEHYLSDVVMGAVLGTVVGHSVASGRDPEFFGWKVLPYASPNAGSGVAFMKSLE